MVADAFQNAIFHQLALLMLLAGVLGFVFMKLRQPLLMAFIIVGLLAGPDMLGLIGTGDTGDDTVGTLAQLGIAVLLFMVGLKLDVGLIRTLGATAVMAGLAQVALCTFLGFVLCLPLGFGPQAALILGLAMSFSSTIIVVKLLSDKHAIDSLYGRMALGILIMQDIVVIVTMVVLSAAGTAHVDGGFFSNAGMIALKVSGLLLLTGLFIQFIANPLSRALARSPELMVIFAIGFAGVAAALCSQAGLSKELGGLLAGVALASTPLNNILAARLMALRDFLLLFFFVNLGAHMHIQGMSGQVVSVIVLSLFVLVGKPLAVFVVMTLLGHRRRTGFMAGLTLGQISEFSLILTVMAQTAGVISADGAAMMTLVALVTIGLSTYAITYNGEFYAFMESRSAVFRNRKARRDDLSADEVPAQTYDALIFGLGRYGTAMARELQKHGIKVMGIDFDPEAVKHAQESGIPALYGDAVDPELPLHLPLEGVRAVVFAFHHHMTGPLLLDLRRVLARSLREHGYKGHIAATSHQPGPSLGVDKDLPEQGIDIVLQPFYDAALHAADKIIGVLAADAPAPEKTG